MKDFCGIGTVRLFTQGYKIGCDYLASSIRFSVEVDFWLHNSQGLCGRDERSATLGVVGRNENERDLRLID